MLGVRQRVGVAERHRMMAAEVEAEVRQARRGESPGPLHRDPAGGVQHRPEGDRAVVAAEAELGRARRLRKRAAVLLRRLEGRARVDLIGLRLEALCSTGATGPPHCGACGRRRRCVSLRSPGSGPARASRGRASCRRCPSRSARRPSPPSSPRPPGRARVGRRSARESAGLGPAQRAASAPLPAMRNTWIRWLYVSQT